MDSDYFVMLNCQFGSVTILMDEEGDEVAFFETKEDADFAAYENPLGKAYGWEVFCLGNGEF